MRYRSNWSRSLFIILFLSYLIPVSTYGQSGSPVQPEYTSYQEPGKSELVNTLTGDMSLNIPVLEVPSPEGGYTIPLFYNAGIGLEQEATWVGLGWNINVGAIQRSIIQFPDDANGQITEVIKNDDILRGWSSNLGPLKTGWNTNVGQYGRFTSGVVNVHWDRNNSGFTTMAGIGMNNGSMTFDPVEFAMFIAMATNPATLATNVARKAAMTGGATTVLSAFTDITPSVNNDGIIPMRTKIQKKFLYRNFWYFIDHTRKDKMYGTLYLQNMDTDIDIGNAIVMEDENGLTSEASKYYFDQDPANTEAAVGDFQHEFEGTNYVYNLSSISPSNIAKDQYRVMAPGISGSIEPYRLEVGSIASPKDFTKSRTQVALVPFEDYKVQFKYKSIFSNSYEHHVSQDELGNPDIDDPELGMESSLWTNPLTGLQHLKLKKIDPPLQDDRIEDNRYGIEAGYLNQAMDVKWYTQSDLTVSDLSANGYLDHEVTSDRVVIRGGLPASMSHQIGAFVITSVDGSRYYFTIPVYSSDFYGWTESVHDPDANTQIKRDAKFATSWLLTAIVGPDYHDENGNGKADYGDFGRWVSFEYGKFSSNYKWRYPYDAGSTKLSTDGRARSYQSGVREQYYLDAIHTRTHTALFIKDKRFDGKGAFLDLNHDGTTDFEGSSSVRLDEIILLRREDYLEAQQLGTALDKNSNAEFGLNHTVLSSLTGDEFSAIYDVEDISNVTLNDFLHDRSIRSVKLGYDYSLADNTPNSFDHHFLDGPKPTSESLLNGKLTLQNVELKGHSGVQHLNDYKFYYESNPDYQLGKWDAWGMYHPSGNEEQIYSHSTGHSGLGTAWSLTSMISPQGGLTKFHYEGDRYGFVSGEPTYETVSFNDLNWTNGIHLNGSHSIEQGHTVSIRYSVVYRDMDIVNGEEDLIVEKKISNVVVESVSANSIFLPPSHSPQNLIDPDDELLEVFGNILIPEEKYGGDIRVQAVEVFGETGESYKTVYDYTLDGELSSGSVSREPDFIKSIEHDWSKHYDFPQTPVLYSKVSVLEGIDPTTDPDTGQKGYDSKTVYEFEVPNATTVIVDQDLSTPQGSGILGRHQQGTFLVKINSAKVGQIKSIKQYEWGNNNPVYEQLFNYENELDNDQGIFTEGSILSEKLKEDGLDYSRAFRTTKVYYPSILKSTTTINREGLQKQKINKAWDFISGKTTEEDNISSNGHHFRTVTTPAYKKYLNMGPYSGTHNTSHMLSQVAEEYSYKVDGGLEAGLLGAQVTEYGDSWSERREKVGNYFEFVPGGYDHVVKSRMLVFNGLTNSLNSDGTLPFTELDKYDFDNPDMTKWEEVSTNQAFDHYSLPLITKDINGQSVSRKTGYDNSFTIIEVANAGYDEIAFSGAEEAPDGSGYFAGEVLLGQGTRVAVDQGNPVHTGSFSVKASNDQETFIYETNKLTAGRSYRFLAWSTNSSGEINYQINNGAVEQVTARDNRKAGDWYQISEVVNMPADFSSIKIWCKGIDANTFYDDFRIQPLEALGQAFVYDRFDQITHSLDNNNLFSEIEYDEHGRPLRVYQETFTGDQGKLKVWEKEYNRGNNTTFFYNITGTENNRCYKAELAAGDDSGYTYNWYVNDDLIDANEVTDGEGYSEYCLPLACFKTLKLEVVDGSGEIIESRSFDGNGEDLVWLNGSTNIQLLSVDPQTNDGTFRVEWNGGLGPYRLEWYRNNSRTPIHTSTVEAGKYNFRGEIPGARCGYKIYAKLTDVCGRYELETSEINVPSNSPATVVTLQETGDRVYTATVTSGLPRSGSSYLYSWSVNNVYRTAEYSSTSSVFNDQAGVNCNFEVRVTAYGKCRSTAQSLDWNGQNELSGDLEILPTSDAQYDARLTLSSRGVGHTSGSFTTKEWTVDNVTYANASESPANAFNRPITRSCDEDIPVSIKLVDGCGQVLIKSGVVQAKNCPNVDECEIDCTLPGCICPPDPIICTQLAVGLSKNLDLPNQEASLDAISFSGTGPFTQVTNVGGTQITSASGSNLTSLHDYGPFAMLNSSQSAEISITDACDIVKTSKVTIPGLSEYFQTDLVRYDKASAFVNLKLTIKGYTAPYTVQWFFMDHEGNELNYEPPFTFNSAVSQSKAFDRGCYPRSVRVIITDDLGNERTESSAIFALADPGSGAASNSGSTVATGCAGDELQPLNIQLDPNPDGTLPIDPADLMPEKLWYYRCVGPTCDGERTAIEYDDPTVTWLPIPKCNGFECCDQFDLPESLPDGTYDIKFMLKTDWGDEGHLLEITRDTISVTL